MELDLDNIAIIHARVEDYKPPIRFDTIIARAFSSLNEFLIYSEHLACKDGLFLAMKGVYPLSEIENINTKFKVDEVIKLNIPDLEAERHVVKVRFK